MATFSMASLAANFPELYRELRSQVQRRSVLLRLLPTKRCLTGDTEQWQVRFSGQVADAVDADGGAFLAPASDQLANATLSPGTYSAPVQVTTKAQWSGSAISMGHDWLVNLFDRAMSEAMEALTKKIQTDLYAGTGTGNRMAGLYLAADSTGTYANIAQGTYASWAGYELGNGNVLQNATLARLKTMASTISTNSPMGRPDVFIVRPALFDSIENLFDAFTQLHFTPSSNQVVVPMGGRNEKLTMNPATISTAGGQIQRTGFRVLFWESQGIYIVEDPDVVDPGITNTTSAVFAINTASTELVYWQPAGNAMFPDQKITTAVEAELGPIANLPVELRARGRTQFADTFDVLAMCTLKVKDRNSCGKLFDQQ